MSKGKARGFTLVEVLVVIGILALLVAILLPALMRMNRSASRTRIAADMNTISTALEAYKQDFGDYPRVNPLSLNNGMGMLGFALLGPGPAVGPPPTYDSAVTYDAGAVVNSGVNYICLRKATGIAVANTFYWAPFAGWQDGADGPGFKTTLTLDTNGDGIPDVAGGKTWGPYINPDRTKTSGMALLDHNGAAILYFPVNKKANPAYANGFVVQGVSPTAMVNANDNFEAVRRAGEANPVVLDRIRLMFGDFNLNGQIDPGATIPEVTPTLSYILWSPGPDDLLGPGGFTPGTDYVENQRQAQKCDDVTNIP